MPTSVPALTTTPSPSPVHAPKPPAASDQPSLTVKASPLPTPSPTTETTARFSIDLYAKGAFASEATKYYCVPAAIEVMENLIGGRPYDTSRSKQDRLYALARSYLFKPFFGRDGAQPEGWAEALNADGYGKYEVWTRDDKKAAIEAAARQLRLTGKPVGLLVWAGFHAWVLSGFTSIGDPAKGDFTVTGLYVEDVWWPRPDTSWGPSPEPDTLLSVANFEHYFLPFRQRHEGGPDKNGKFVVIVPTS